MNTVGRWYIQPFIIALVGLILLRLLPGFVGIAACFILCNAALINGIRNRQRSFALAGITLSIIGLLVCLYLIYLFVGAVLFVQGTPHIYHLS